MLDAKQETVREAFKNVLADFFRLGGTPLPYPLNGKSFCQKTLSGKGGVPPPPLNGQSLCSKKLSGKGGYPPLNGQNPLKRF